MESKSGKRKHLCVDDTGPGPTLTVFLLAGFVKPVSHISDIFEFGRATFSRLLFFSARHQIGARKNVKHLEKKTV